MKLVTVLAAVALLSACGGGGPTSSAVGGPGSATPGSATPTSTRSGGSGPSAAISSPLPSTRPAVAGRWRLGASPLPLRPDGFGQVLPTPTVLRDRRLATVDLLRPPVAERFMATIGAVTPAIRTRMGETWSPACPVRLTSLRYLTVVFRGFDGKAHRGELVVAAGAAAPIVRVFRTLYDVGFPIEEMRLPTTRDLRARPTGDGNDTAGYVCRTARGQRRFSAHAYGVAIDVNPFQNPELKGDLVVPELASAYRTRSWHRPGMLLAGEPAVRAFAGIGWRWGGAWHSLKDPMHFSATGR